MDDGLRGHSHRCIVSYIPIFEVNSASKRSSIRISWGAHNEMRLWSVLPVCIVFHRLGCAVSVRKGRSVGDVGAERRHHDGRIRKAESATKNRSDDDDRRRVQVHVGRQLAHRYRSARCNSSIWPIMTKTTRSYPTAPICDARACRSAESSSPTGNIGSNTSSWARLASPTRTLPTHASSRSS